MSRSFREPWFKDTNGSPYKRWAKQQANRAVRRTKDVPDGKTYRKLYDPWKIVDYRSKWDPWPRYTIDWRTGEIVVVDPIPGWKARMK
jgi:hypothetical protein